MSPSDSPFRLKELQPAPPTDVPAGERYGRLARLAIRALDASAVLIALADRRYFRCAAGVRGPLAQVREFPAGTVLCERVLTAGEPVVVADIAECPDLPSHAQVRALGVASYAGVPLVAGDGSALGSLYALQDAPRPWSEEDLDTLCDLASAVTAEARGETEARARGEAEREMAVQSEYLQQLFEGAPEGIALLDAGGRVIRTNGEFARMFGYAPEEAEGRPINDLIVPAGLRDEAAELTEHVALGHHVRLERVRIRNDGTPLQVLISAAPVRVDQEQVAVYAIYRDMTEHREILQEREARFRSLIENSSDVVAILSAGGSIDYVTPSVERFLGYAPAKLLGDNAFSFVHPNDAAPLLERFARTLRNGDCGEPLECQVRHADGSWRTFEIHANNLLDNPAVAGIVINSRDITDAREAKQTQRRLGAFLEATPDFVAIFDPRGRALSVNSALRAAVGIGPDDDLSAVTLSDLFPHRITERLLQEGIPAAIRSGVWAGETLLQRSDGEEVPISQVILAHKSAGGAVEFLSTLGRDITERKQAEAALRHSEEHFRSLIENALDIITILDAQGTIQFESPSVERVLGYTPEELQGRNAFDLVHPEDLPRVREIFARGISVPGLIETTEYRFLHRDGTWRVMESAGENLLDDPAVAGVVVNSRDITERKVAEAALHESQEQLLQSQKMDAVGRLAGGVAHDFNNLLTAIKGFTELLLLDFDQRDPRYPFVHEIQAAANRAASLTRQLLAFSRKQVLQPRVIDLNASVADMEKMLQRLIGEDVELQTRKESDLGRVKADPGQIEQVLLNLVVNARDAMPGGGRLSITTSNVEVGAEQAQPHPDARPGSYVALAVRDTGSGMTKEVQRRIFEPFFTTKGQGKGTGLGLSTVYGIVQQSGGFIEVESELENGTEFRVYLPRVEEEVQAATRTVAMKPLTGNEAVLLVEDEQAVRVLVRRVLDRMGYTVLEAENGAAALELLRRHSGPVDLLLTDVIMPGMSGRELADQLIPRFPDLKVLFMSGYTDEAISHHGVLVDGVAFLEKPFTPDILLHKVRETLSAPSSVASA